MKQRRVTGLGGVFIKYKNPSAIKEWYNKHLGLPTDDYGTNFETRSSMNPSAKNYTVWSTFSEDTEYFNPSDQNFMLNFRVADLVNLVELLKEEGVTILDEIETYDYGKFVHILDLEGNKIELWEPIDTEYERMVEKSVLKS